MTLWTRLSSEPIWGAARSAHQRGRGRIYHDWDRILRIYRRAEVDLRLPYDRALDLAILSHSAVIDIGGDRRPRSAAWLRSRAGQDESVETACRMILAGPYGDLSDPRLPLLDLSDLSDPETAGRAIRDMADQVQALTRLPRRDVMDGVTSELSRIRRAVRAALPRIQDPDQRRVAERVMEGAVPKHEDNRKPTF